jgi:predicted adenylyl cyclase CyaB
MAINIASKYEVEFRGTLTKKQYLKLADYLNINCKQSQPDNKTTHFFVTKGFILKVIESESKTTANITVKVGDETSNILEELEIPIAVSDVGKSVELFKKLGFKDVNVVKQKRVNYKYNSCDISLKYTADWGYHFEIEACAKNVIEARKKKTHLNKVCSELGLKPMNPKQIRDKITQINKNHGFIK